MAHHVLLGLAVAALLGTGFRLASVATPTGLERTLAAVVYAAALAVLEAIVLGRFGVGARSLPLGVVAGLTWVTAVLVLPAPEVSATSELRGAWRRTGTWARVGLGVTGGVGLAFAVWLLRHPSIGLDSNLYHYLEVSRWLHDGGIGGFERLDYGVSYSSYPLTNEVLLAWGSGIARSFVPPRPVDAVHPRAGGRGHLARAAQPRRRAGPDDSRRGGPDHAAAGRARAQRAVQRPPGSGLARLHRGVVHRGAAAPGTARARDRPPGWHWARRPRPSSRSPSASG